MVRNDPIHQRTLDLWYDLWQLIRNVRKTVKRRRILTAKRRHQRINAVRDWRFQPADRERRTERRTDTQTQTHRRPSHRILITYCSTIFSDYCTNYTINYPKYCVWLSSVLRPLQHSIGYMGDGFYRSRDTTNSIKVLKENSNIV